MAPAMSPPPSWEAMREPTPSDEDLVPNDSASFSTQRKRKNKSKSTAQPQSKRPKTTESSNTSSRRTSDAATGRRRFLSPSSRAATGSNGIATGPPIASGSKTSRHSMSQPTGKTAEPVSSARTRPIRRTHDEKKRQRSSVSSDEMPPAPTSLPRKQSASLPSASAPPVRNGHFERDKIRQRFQSGESSKASSSRGPKSAPVKGEDVVDLESTPEPAVPPKPKPKVVSSEIIELSDDSDSEATKIRKRSAARKAQKQMGAPPAPPDPRDVVVIDISDNDDDVAARAATLHISEKSEPPDDDLSARSPLPGNRMDLGDHDGMDFGEGPSLPDLAEPGVGLSEIPVESPPKTLSPAVETSRAETKPPQQQANGPSAVNPPIVVPPEASDGTVVDLPLLPASSAIANDGQADKPLRDLAGGNALPFQEQRSISPPNEAAGHVAQDRAITDDQPLRSLQTTVLSAEKSQAPAAPQSPPEKFSLARPTLPNGLPNADLDQNRDILPDQALLSVSKPQSKSKPTPLPLPRPRPPIPDSPVASTSRNQPASPYKTSLDGALSKSVAALQRTLGLPVEGQESTHPRLDLSSLPRRPLPSPKRRKTPPRSLLLDPDPAPGPEESTSVQSALPGTPSLPPLVKKLRSWSQKSLVEALTTAERRASSSNSPLSRPSPLPPPPAPLPQPTSSASPAPAAPTTPASASAPPPQPVKPEVARLPSSGAITSLSNDIIDLTLDEEPDATNAPQVNVPAQATQVTPAQAPRLPERRPPLASAASIEDQRRRDARRMRNFAARLQGRSVSFGSLSNPQSPAVSAAPVAKPQNANAPTAAGDVLKRHPDRLDKSPADNPGRSPTPMLLSHPEASQNDVVTPSGLDDLQASVLAPHDDGPPEMEVDNGAVMPLPLEPPSVPEPQDAPAVVRSSDSVEREPDAPALPAERPMNFTDHHPPAAPTYEQRSYDDVEVYDLEYIGPPELATPTSTDSEEAAVEELVAMASATDDSPVREVVDVRSERPSTTPERDFVEASDRESSVVSVSASPKPPVRRSSRNSSTSSTTDPLDFLANPYENESDSRAVSPDDMISNSLPMSPVSDVDSFFDDIDDTSLSSVEPTTATQYPIVTWQSYKQDLKNFRPRVYYAADLRSQLHDYIHSFHESFRTSPHMRHVFESAIRENTADDEPDAPWIDIINEVDDEPTPPWEFYYTNKLWLGDGIDPPDITKLVGCDCKGRCDPKSKTCSCLKRQREFSTGYFADGFAYDQKGRLKVDGVPIFECNSLCACDDDECKNRVVQHGRKCHVAIKKTVSKGWGVFATKRIPKGTFIGIYSGEFLRDEICERRGLVYDKSGRTYLLNNDWYYLSDKEQFVQEYVVDAYHVGNFTRFLNHSCDPNCKVTPCYIDEPDLTKSLITLFASRDIPAGDELCFAYGGDPDIDDPENEAKAIGSMTKNKCYCGATNCRGFMF